MKLKKKENMERLNFTLQPKLVKKLRDTADNEDRKMSVIVRRALQQYLKKGCKRK